MFNIDKNSFFWKYLSDGQKGLIEEGLYLLNDIKDHPDANISDYSYLVFPFAKAYEGFLKKIFLDMGFVTKQDYESDHFRIGKALNPHLERKFYSSSVYRKLVQYCQDREFADSLWQVWKRGRNLVFHYFPHNFKALSLAEAEGIIEEILIIMENAVVKFQNNLPSGS